MKRALSILDNKDLDAIEFSTKDDHWQASRRGSLTCLGCSAPAFFRPATPARSPSFGAFHSKFCLLVRTKTVFHYQE
jgi:hypothetical protein